MAHHFVFGADESPGVIAHMSLPAKTPPADAVLELQPRLADAPSFRQQMGHIWLGFSEDHIKRLLAGAGFDRVRIVASSVNAAAKGPALFVATARKAGG